MSQTTWLTTNRYSTAIPKLAIAFRKIDADSTVPLKKNDNASSTENSKVDTVEMSDTYKKINTPRKETGASVLQTETKELVNYVRKRAELRKPISSATGGSFIKTGPNAEEIERAKLRAEEAEQEKAWRAKYQKVVAKIKNGKLPNAEEMNLLKEHDPELYMDAKRLEREIQQFRNQLRNCDTKEERTRLVMIKKKMLAEEAKIITRASKNTKEPVFVLGMITAMDREVEEDDKRKGIVKKADDAGIKMRNGLVANVENSNVNTVEIADIPKTSLDPEKNDSEINEDESGSERKPLDKPNTAAHHYEKIAHAL